MINNIKIKPCPFCGHEAILKINREHLYIVQCDKCEATSKICESENEAAEAWNTRKPIDKVVEQLEELSNKYCSPRHLDCEGCGHYALEEAIDIVHKYAEQALAEREKV